MNKAPSKLAELVQEGMKNSDFAEGYKSAAIEQDGDDWDCGCPEGAEEKCVSVVCPRK